ncbi:MAG TPA: outer membrane beta-barrel protein [Chthoniobacterales bacterium]|jgi:outer membrane immunogenic protein|nr:outer membrane beta-barrel protein [Chthoniobacterales bacterium]
MKKSIALTVAVLTFIGLTQIAVAGPQAFSGKETKEIAPAPAPECDWTGFYVGAIAGYARGDMNWRDVDFDSPMNPPETIVNNDQSGFIGGGELGFNYQWHWVVLGIEGTFAYSDLQQHHQENAKSSPDTFDTRSDWQGTVSGRLGFAWNNLLFFAKGGGAFVQQRYTWLHNETFSNEVDTFKSDETRASALVGGGIEYRINCRWSVKAEYDHYFLGTDTITGPRTDDGLIEKESYDTTLNQDVVLVGVNYKFWRFH